MQRIPPDRVKRGILRFVWVNSAAHTGLSLQCSADGHFLPVPPCNHYATTTPRNRAVQAAYSLRHRYDIYTNNCTINIISSPRGSSLIKKRKYVLRYTKFQADAIEDSPRHMCNLHSDFNWLIAWVQREFLYTAQFSQKFFCLEPASELWAVLSCQTHKYISINFDWERRGAGISASL